MILTRTGLHTRVFKFALSLEPYFFQVKDIFPMNNLSNDDVHNNTICKIANKCTKCIFLSYIPLLDFKVLASSFDSKNKDS